MYSLVGGSTMIMVTSCGIKAYRAALISSQEGYRYEVEIDKCQPSGSMPTTTAHAPKR